MRLSSNAGAMSVPSPLGLLASIENIASLPNAYLNLSRVIDDPRTTSREVGEILSEDPALAARLLRLANSALYGHPSRIDTIIHAVSVIGLRGVHELALATTVMQAFDDQTDVLVSMNDFWRHSIACAIVARILAIYAHLDTPERFFIIGLLHDIGRLIIYMAIPDTAAEIVDHAKQNRGLLYDSEKKLLGYSQSEVGYSLLKQWKLPGSVVNAIRYAHDPLGAGKYSRDAALAHVADAIATGLQAGCSGETHVPPLQAGAWEQLKLPEAILTPLLEQFEIQYESAMEALMQTGGG
ncbi:MAG: HDOD domain-containing protein [Gammaproteobacteria bacterium]|nr:HDOD domain-containing protein [Gammaproteobacteria bacterium]MDH5801189.1 HDOD domain-containing protein [Gammaproteobacteria bacterium]